MSLKKTVIALMMGGMSIPFILQTDLYPFFRFGMFAEPVKRSIQVEQFAVYYRNGGQTYMFLDPEKTGLGSLTYLMRNYYYRGEADKLLQHIHRAYQTELPVHEWRLIRITSALHYPFVPDSTVVARFEP